MTPENTPAPKMSKEEILHSHPILNHTLNKKPEKEILSAMQEYSDSRVKELEGEVIELKKQNYDLSAEITSVSDGYDRAELKKEIERLKGLIEYCYKQNPITTGDSWQQFKSDNKL